MPTPVSSYRRYHIRKERWARKKRVLPGVRHHLWWVLHNCVSHPVLGVVPNEKTVFFHDWTSKHLNLHKKLRPSYQPEIGNFAAWAWHNVVGHMAIGLFPVEAAFNFHDRTCEAMSVPHWV